MKTQTHEEGEESVGEKERERHVSSAYQQEQVSESVNESEREVKGVLGVEGEAEEEDVEGY